MTIFVLNASNARTAGSARQCTLRVDGDKSISHRAVMFASLAQGESEIEGFLHGEDTRCTANILRQLGVSIIERNARSLRVRGVGLHGLQGTSMALDCGNAGTGMRLLAGLLAGQRFSSSLIGDASLSKRPMRRVLAPLRLMGAQINGTTEDTAPLRIHAAPGKLRAIAYESPVASAQVKSCVLLAGMYADAQTSVREPEATRDHTERMLQNFGATLQVDGLISRITPEPRLRAQALHIPADPSSAAFFAAAAALVPGLCITLSDVCINPRRIGLFDTLKDMGASVRFDNPRALGGETVADITVQGGALRGVQVPAARVADMIDEFPIFLILAACAQGDSKVEQAQELRVKESDRIAAMVAGLRSLGVHCDEFPDGVRIVGLGNASADPCLGQRGASVTIDAHGDHRIAMSFAIASLRSLGEIKILDCANVATSFPSFADLAVQAGIDLVVQSSAVKA
jgi:3-phosphoshikimate 1-carboxyvinyltransferase